MAPTETSRRRALLLLLWATAVHAAGLYLFTTGFFLTRFEVPDVSECRVPPHHDAASASRLRAGDTGSAEHVAGGCWMPRRFRRVVFVVVDALRFDFVRSPSTTAAAAAPSFFLNHLPVLSATLHAQPANALLLKFVADPPTMTMQRLKGLTTGSLPTFLDIKDNMASSEITEDNLLLQMHRARRPVVFMGDDTWDALYAPLFMRKYSFDSFNVRDLHSVDHGVVANLFPELQRRDWELLIAHFLGVDHVGHTHGPSSPFMAEKLDEMNGVLARLLDELAQDERDDTLLLVMGDHGMSADGNHGGASDDETGAALFLYSKQRIVDSAHAARWPQEVPQVDLVPTIALLAGLPIPFGSLGSVIPQLFGELKTLADALALNVAQVRRYLLTYSAASKLPQTDFDHLERIHDEIRALTDAGSSGGDWGPLVAKQQAYLREALALGRSIWTQFDLCGMGWGIALLLAGQSLVGVLILGYEPRDILRVAAVGAATGGVLGAFIPPVLSFLPRSLFSRSLALAALGSFLTPLVSSPPSFRTEHVAREDDPRGGVVTSSTLVAFVTVLLHVLGLLSNSYIVAEAKVMNFLTATVGLFLVWFAQRHAPDAAKSRVVVAALVFIAASRTVGAIDPPNIIQSATSVTRTWVPLASIAAAAVNTRTQRLNPSQTALQSTSVVWAALACGVYWHFSPIASWFWRLWLPRSVFLLALAAIVHRVWTSARRSSPSPSMDGVSFTALLLLAFSLVLGPSSPLTVLCIALQHVSFAFVAHACFAQSTSSPPLAWVFLWCAVCYQSFFATGHQNTFTSLQNAAGFVGFDDFRFYWAGALLGLNTFGSYALALLVGLPLLGRFRRELLPWKPLLAVVAYFSLNALVSTAFVALQRRHLMVWAIFAPKFIFDGATLLVVELLAMVTIGTVTPPQPLQAHIAV